MIIYAIIINHDNKNLTKEDLKILKDELGVVGTIQFLDQIDNGGSGDYTLEKYQNNDAELCEDEIRKLFGL